MRTGQNRRPGEGDRPCPALTRQGTQCTNNEIEGLEFCLLHMPDEYLDEAEELTGFRRCRHWFGTPDACTRYAVEHTQPPMCTDHGANRGSHQSGLAAVRGIDAKAAERLTEILSEHGEKLLRPDPVSDPLSELLELAAEMKALKEILRQVAAYLYSKDRIRYAHAKVGEQLRMEILLYERAVERYAKILIDISKLKIEERLAGIRQQTADMLERALDAAIEEMQVGLDRRQPAKEAFRRHLRVVAAA